MKIGCTYEIETHGRSAAYYSKVECLGVNGQVATVGWYDPSKNKWVREDVNVRGASVQEIV